MLPTVTDNSGYPEFLAQLKASIRQRQYQALRAVNRELLALYWEIGQAIHQKQEEQGWGKAVVETLAHDLQAEFPGRNGFSAQNLWLMRQFYREYNELPKLQPLVREISWAKNLVILARIKDPLEREFYLRATARFGWTKAVLQHQIDNQSYQKYLLNQTNFDQALPDEIKAQASLAVKDRYTFDFLELAEEHGERQLEQALVANLRQFLTELGGAFAFIGNQYRLEIGGKHRPAAGAMATGGLRMTRSNSPGQVRIQRFPTNPLSIPALFNTLGDNINGPSVICAPDWRPNPLGRYDMDLARHAGTTVRLAFAGQLEGPWEIYKPGTLPLSDAEAFCDHIASPDVHVDDASRLFRLPLGETQAQDKRHA